MALDRDCRRRRRGRFLAVALSGAAALVAAGEGVAQPADANQGRRSLAPLTVTVHPGVEQPAFDTPASIDVIDGEVLRDGQLQVNLSEALARVPGVVALNRQNYAQDLQISLRGFGARSTFGVRGIRLYVDGIPATAPDGQGQVSHFDLSSAGRLEVLRGPFSALYGNSSGGVISLFTEEGGPDTVAACGHSVGQRRRAAPQRAAVGRDRAAAVPPERDALSHRRLARAQRRRAHQASTASCAGGLSDDTRLTLVANGVDMPDVQDPLGLTRAAFEADPRQAVAAATLFDTRKSVRQQQLGLILDHRLDRGQRAEADHVPGRAQHAAVPVHSGGGAGPAHARRRGGRPGPQVPGAGRALDRHGCAGAAGRRR